jgi:hypothetical protein
VKRHAALLCLLVVALASCSGSDDGSGSSAGDGSSATTTAAEGLVDPEAVIDPLGDELATIREANDGVLPLQDALDLYASTFGAIPGGDSTRFPVAADSGDIALRAVMRYWEQLTTEQQDAIRALHRRRPSSLAGPGRPRSGNKLPLSPAPPGTGPAPEVSYSSEEEQAIEDNLRAEVYNARAAYEARLGIHLPDDYYIDLFFSPGEAPTDERGRSPIGDAGPNGADGELLYSGVPRGCTIRVFDVSDTSIITLTVYHEVFHCFQYYLVGDAALAWAAQDWILEGSAEWAGNELVPHEHGRRRFQMWVSDKHSLYSMAYEAIGYYFVLDSLGVSPWDVIDDMLDAQGGVAAVAASGLDPEEVLSRVITSKARANTIASLGVSDRWDFSASNVPHDGYFARATVTPSSPNRATFALGRFAAGPVEVLHLDGGSIVQVALNGGVGTLEFFGQDPIEWNGSLVREFCLEEEGCSCGAGPETLEHGTRDLILGAGQLDAGRVTYDVRIPDVAFTDGEWEGTITSPDLTIVGDAGNGFRPGATAPINFTIEAGVVTSGVYTVDFPAIFESPMGSATGVVQISGQVTGCAQSPKLDPVLIDIDATIEIADGFTIPVQTTINYASRTVTVQQGDGPPIVRPFEGAVPDTPTGFTSWIIQPPSTPTHRVGELDASAELATMAMAGFAVSELQFTFDISRG